MDVFARAAITKLHRLDALHNGNLFSHSSGGWKPKIKMLAGLFFPRPPSLACRWQSYYCILMWSLLCVLSGCLSVS